MLTLKLLVRQKRFSYSCPFDGCGDLIKPDPLDTPPRNFAELAEALIASHFMGQCSWCTELGDGRIGRIEVCEADSGVMIPFYVFTQAGKWRCSKWAALCTGNVTVPDPLKLQQNPLFGGVDPEEALQSRGCTQIALGSLPPGIREAVDIKNQATQRVLKASAMMSTAARLLILATAGHLPDHEAAHNAFAVTEAAVTFVSSAEDEYRLAEANLLQHVTPPDVSDDPLQKEYKEFVRKMRL